MSKNDREMLVFALIGLAALVVMVFGMIWADREPQCVCGDPDAELLPSVMVRPLAERDPSFPHPDEMLPTSPTKPTQPAKPNVCQTNHYGSNCCGSRHRRRRFLRCLHNQFR